MCVVIPHDGLDLNFPFFVHLFAIEIMSTQDFNPLKSGYLFVVFYYLVEGVPYICWILTPYLIHGLKRFSPVRLVAFSLC